MALFWRERKITTQTILFFIILLWWMHIFPIDKVFLWLWFRAEILLLYVTNTVGTLSFLVKLLQWNLINTHLQYTSSFHTWISWGRNYRIRIQSGSTAVWSDWHWAVCCSVSVHRPLCISWCVAPTIAASESDSWAVTV